MLKLFSIRLLMFAGLTIFMAQPVVAMEGDNDSSGDEGSGDEQVIKNGVQTFQELHAEAKEYVDTEFPIALPQELLNELNEHAQLLDTDDNDAFQQEVKELQQRDQENAEAVVIEDEEWKKIVGGINEAVTANTLNTLVSRERAIKLKKMAKYYNAHPNHEGVKAWDLYRAKYATFNNQAVKEYEQKREELNTLHTELQGEHTELKNQVEASKRTNKNLLKILDDAVKEEEGKAEVKKYNDLEEKCDTIQAEKDNLKNERDDLKKLVEGDGTEMQPGLRAERDNLKKLVDGVPDDPSRGIVGQEGLYAQVTRLTQEKQDEQTRLQNPGAATINALKSYRNAAPKNKGKVGTGTGLLAYVVGLAPVLRNKTRTMRNGKTQTVLRLAALDREAWSTALSQSFNYTWKTVASVFNYGYGMSAIFSKILPSGKEKQKPSQVQQTQQKEK